MSVDCIRELQPDTVGIKEAASSLLECIVQSIVFLDISAFIIAVIIIRLTLIYELIYR